MKSLDSNQVWWDEKWQRQPGLLSSVVEKLERGMRNIIYGPVIRELLEGVSLKRGDILELGCGTGLTSLNIAREFGCASVTLLDFSRKALERARREIEVVEKQGRLEFKVETVQADALHPPFWNKKKFDLVHSTGLAEHFFGEERRKIIHTHAHLTQKNGWVMILVPKKGTVVSSLFGVFNKVRGFQEEYFSEGELTNLIRKSGLRPIKKSYLLGNGSLGILAVKKDNKR